MKFSIALQALGGAAMVTALSVPTKRQMLDLNLFGWFETISLEDAQAAAAADTDSANTDASPEGVADTDSTAPTGTQTDAVTDDVSAAAVPSGPCATPHIRVEWRNMAEADRQSFLSSVKCLMDAPAKGGFSTAATNRYEELVSVHQQMTNSIHMNGLFLPWHRYYVWVFMRLLREECGYTAAFPWWDEVKDGGHFAQSPLFTSAYFGSLPGSTNGQGTCITDGAFGGRTLHIGPGTSNSAHCLARAVDEAQTANVNQNFMDTCNGRATYSDMESCSEMGPHAYGHNGIGAVMAEVSASPGDPIFFMHHSFVDRMWRKWQIKDDTRVRSISGCATPGDNCTPLTLDTKLSSMGMREEVTVGDILDIYNDKMCYLYDY
ncbi:hypothetical protein SLS62_000516 [Diatrype stigma]|uniref:Tyrosinase copper-binding domain-containing protein n=1 Tax=Diatrype stigma TaxID=117547 RepID=A0AAN9V1I8_9PEZI